MDSRSSSLHRGMRNHSPTPMGEAMSQVQADSYEGPISREKRERGLRRLWEGPGIQIRTLRTSLGTTSGVQEGVRQEGEGEEAAEGSEVRRLRSLRDPDPKEWECQVLWALLGR